MKCKLCNMQGEYKLNKSGVDDFYCQHHTPVGATTVVSFVEQKTRTKSKSVAPLLWIILGIMLVSSIRQVTQGFDGMMLMMDFMGVFLVTFGLFKLYDLVGFVTSFTTYDFVAKKSKSYAYIYPFIEILLGAIYLAGYMFTWQNIIVLLLSILGMISAYTVLKKKEEIVCVCLGTLFDLPMTWVTFIENALMGIMIVSMLLLEI